MKIQTAFVLLAALTSAAATGCSQKGDPADNPGTARASLHRAKDCGGLLSDLKSDALYKLNTGIDRQIESIQKCIARNGGSDQSCLYGGYYGVGFAEGDSNGRGGGAPTGADPSSGEPSPTSPGSSPSDQASSHSDTNNQVAGVDEADFVKTDGKNLYVIHGNAFKVLKAWPANELAELSSIDIEGTPSEMFVQDGKVVVYSQVNGASLYAATGVQPKNGYQDYYAYGGVSSGAADMPMQPPGTGTPEVYVPLTKITVLTLDGATPSVAREMYFEGSYLDSRRVGTHVRTVLTGAAHGPALKYSVYDLYPPQEYPGTAGNDPGTATPPSTPSNPGPSSGSGVGTKDLPTPIADGTPYPTTGAGMIAALEQLRAYDKAAIDASQLSDWLPYTFTKNGGAVVASSVACEDFYVPNTGSAESGLTEVASIDLADPSAMARETAILSRAETVYGSADTLYLAAQAWIEPPYAWSDGGGDVATSGGTTASPPPDTDSSSPPPSPSPGVGTESLHPTSSPTMPPVVTAWTNAKTHIHKFEFTTDAGFPNYVASGTVAGTVKDQFSLDDKDGILRVATSESRTYIDQDGKYVSPTSAATGGVQDKPSSVNHVFTLGVNGGWLDLVGDAGELAPNEQIYSVRFIEGRGYVVTYRQVDPLFVIDLQNPSAPTKIAELTIPGFSEYMHPLDATHLLTIGRAGTATGQVQGLQLQIFDVSDGAHPVQTQTFAYSGSEYGQSDAEYDHKAFTYFADQGMLAFPYFGYDMSGGAVHSSLELFKVDAAAGFTKIGSIDNTDLVAQNPTGYCGGYFGPQVRRGVFLDNFIYSVSYGGVVVKNANDFAAPATELHLSTPVVNDGYGPQCAVDGVGGR